VNDAIYLLSVALQKSQQLIDKVIKSKSSKKPQAFLYLFLDQRFYPVSRLSCPNSTVKIENEDSPREAKNYFPIKFLTPSDWKLL